MPASEDGADCFGGVNMLVCLHKGLCLQFETLIPTKKKLKYYVMHKIFFNFAPLLNINSWIG